MATTVAFTNRLRAIIADRLKGTPSTYTNPPKYLGIGTGATGASRTAAVTDTALTTEVETRAAGTESTVTTTVTGDTYQTQGTITLGSNRNVDEAATFDASSSGNIGLSATFTALPLSAGDSLQLTFKAVIG